jgi:translation initiation factor eIF-2B subunit delta
VSTIVKSGEVILTYGRSSAVEATLLLATTQQKDIRVIIVDSRPYQEGKQLLSFLLARDSLSLCVAF